MKRQIPAQGYGTIALLACMASMTAAPARAQGFDGERFAPAAGAAGAFVLERPVVPAHLGYGAGLFLHFADDAVVLRDRQTGSSISKPLDHALSADFLASLGLFDFAEIAFHLPVRLIYDGEAATVDGTALQAAAGIGDVRLVPKASFLWSGDESSGFVLGAALPLTLPTGRQGALRGAGGVTAEPRLLALAYGGRWILAGSGGFRIRGRDDAFAPGHELTLGLAATYSPQVEGDWLDLHAEAMGGWIPGLDGRALVGLPLEVLAGAILRPDPRWSFYAGAGIGITNGIAIPDFRVVVGARYAVGLPLRGGAQDRDGDGVPDRDDRCPEEPEDRDGFQDADGCPDADNDGDGIPDDRDECPDDAEEPGGDGDGCPDKARVMVRKGKLVVYGKVQFAVGSAQILPKSEQLLDEMAKVLDQHPQIKRVEIQGHTDSTGDANLNLKLSQARSENVRQALLKRGIAPDRLVAKGYGQNSPIAPNETPAGRAKNRRVEFSILR
jgi:OmpA-OmpF porin, OOP family